MDTADADVWDDSALVDSWNAALEEYKVGVGHRADFALVRHHRRTDEVGRNTIAYTLKAQPRLRKP